MHNLVSRVQLQGRHDKMEASLNAARGALASKTRWNMRKTARSMPRTALRPKAVAKPRDTVQQHVGKQEAPEVRARERSLRVEKSLAVVNVAFPLYLVAASPAMAFDLSFFSLENVIQLGLVLGFYIVVGPVRDE